MAIYCVNIDRQVLTWERFTRYVKADTQEQAVEAAQALAEEANTDCPDDCTSGPALFTGNFEVRKRPEEVQEHLILDDIYDAATGTWEGDEDE